ncbi:MAG TPA: diacylglycerol kinase family protein [Solirubrobacteraceae bacterium]|nr:diacylglycerol kinase family protein [Solirubrobacteraceae bacterium]
MLSLIVNPSAGGGRAGKVLPEVQAGLSELGIEYHVERTRSLEHARELARAAADGNEIAAALGGDGLIGAVADVLKDCDGVLGVLPGGRGNDFARVLGIPLEARAACDVLAHGEIRRLDLGRVGASTFIGIASCGFDSDANRIANETKLVRGNLVYTYGALRALWSWKPARFEVRVDGGEPHVVSGYTVAVANSKAYGGGMYMAPDASLEDGQFDVIIVGHVPKGRFLRLLPTVFKGEHVRQPNVVVLRGQDVHVSADRPFTMYADGDPIAELPVTVDVLPGAVRVLVPAGPMAGR